MKILVTGKSGQVGYELERSLQCCGQVHAVDRSQLDLADLDQVRRVIRDVRPDLIVNPAAYTAVDLAETEQELAMRINGETPGVMAEEAKRLGAALIHYSTDYVFNGQQPSPYQETDPTDPINTYGRTKLAGEEAIRAVGGRHMILRTSWVYGMRGKNFLLTMLRLAQERSELRVVGDQHGAPTWSVMLADMTARVAEQAKAASDSVQWWEENGGVYHLSSAGSTTWAGFAHRILENAGLATRVTPITTAEYPVPAKRPQYSMLCTDKFAKRFGPLPQWSESLRRCQS